MKTHAFLLFCLTLSLTACDQEGMFLKQGDLHYVLSDTHAPDAITILSALSMSDTCLELNATHWLSGFGVCRPVIDSGPLPHTEKQGAPINRGPGVRYSIAAGGDAMSELFARGRTDLNLIYDSVTRKLNGTMSTVFFNGEVLEIQVDARALVTAKGKHLLLEVEMHSADLRMDSGFYELVHGEVFITLPIAPEGPVEITLQTTAMLCVSEIE